MRKYLPLLILILTCPLSQVNCQTYSTLITDKEYYDFINMDILRDSVKVQHHILRKRYRLILDEFYYKDSLDFEKKNSAINLTHFIFSRHYYNRRIITNDIDTVFTRRDIDFFYDQFLSMKKYSKWKTPFINSVLIDSVEYENTEDGTFGRKKPKYGVWQYSLPLFSIDRRFAIIIKANSVGGGYYIYKRNESNEWFLLKRIFHWTEG